MGRTALAGSVGAVRRVLPLAQLGVRRALGQRSPFQMTLSLTNRCNFRCEYCHIPLQERAEMTTEQWCTAIDELVAGGMGRASLIGGEPMLRKDLGEILAHMKRRGVHAAMNTNGWFVEERLDELQGLDVACVTIDGPREVHDRQRHAGSYDRAVRAVELLRSRGMGVVTMTVLTPSGAQSIPHVLEVAKSLGVRAFFQLEHDADCDVNLPIAPRLSDDLVSAMARELLEKKDEGWPVGNSRTLLHEQLRDGRRIGGDCTQCYAGRYFGYVMSDGTVAPCLLTQWQVEKGNGLRHGFLRAFQELAAPRGPGCACVPIHEVNSILAFDVRVLFSALELAVGGLRAWEGSV